MSRDRHTWLPHVAVLGDNVSMRESSLRSFQFKVIPRHEPLDFHVVSNDPVASDPIAVIFNQVAGAFRPWLTAFTTLANK